jgi:choline-sulfatase
MPTLIELAGGNVQSLGIGLDGRSLTPHLRGAGGHDEAIGEYLAEGAIAPIVMIRRGPYKFIHSPADPDQLYDLSRDPGERLNLADDPARAAAAADFRAEVGRRWDLAELDARVRLSQRRRRVVDAALSKGKVHAWDFQPFRNASKQYVRNSMDLDDLEAMARFPPVARP